MADLRFGGSVPGARTQARRLVAGLWAIGLTALAGITLGGQAGAAQPVPGHTQLAPDRVRTNTPRITTGEITDIEVVGNRVYLAGSFTSIANANGTSYAQRYLAAYDINTGLVDPNFRPTISSTVEAVEASPDGSSLYIGGAFNTVNGVTKRKVAKINPATGAPITAFTANASARVTSLAVSNNWVYVGGQFKTMNGASRSMLAAVNPTTGATDTGFNIPITEGIGSGGVLKVEQLQLTPDDSSLLVVHTGRNVGGQQRVAAALINTAGKSLRPWNTNLYADYLPAVGGVIRVTNGTISPDGQYFAMTSGGGGDRPPVNDTVVAFPINPTTGPIDDVDPIWVSRHFDSLYGVVWTEQAVYVAGHFRYQEAPTATQPWPGNDTTNYGWGESQGAGVLGETEVVRRDMLGALDPATGTSLPWNPGAEAALGHGHLEATPRGLFVGMDSSVINGQAIGRHGFFDWNNVPAPSGAETYVDYPFDGGIVAGGGVLNFEGRAEANSGVNRVELIIQTQGSGTRYLQDNLTTWSTTYNTINATVANPGQVNSDWALEVANFPAGDYRVRARAYGVNGTRDSTWSDRKFVAQEVDNPAPVTSFTTPGFGTTIYPGPVTFAGTSADDTGVVAVTVEIRNRDTQFFLQDDGSLAPQRNTFDAELSIPGGLNTLWSLDVSLPAAGNYVATAVATDSEGQVEHEGLGRFFTVADSTNLPPAVTLTTPVTGTTVGPNTAVQIQGTATDDTSVRRVEVSVRNNSTGYGVQIDGTYGPVPAYFTIAQGLDTLSHNFNYTTPPLPVGSYTIRVRATDANDVRTPTTAVPPSTIAQPNIALTVGVAGDALPNTTLDFAGSTQDYELLTLPITGVATDDIGVSNVRLTVYNSTTREYLTNTAGALSFTSTAVVVPVQNPGATSTPFSATFTLPKAGNYRITAVAVDSNGQLDGSTTGATATYLIFPGDINPYLNENLTAPDPGSTYTNFIPIGGRAEDDISITRVNITVRQDATGLFLRTDGTFGASQTLGAFLTNPGGQGSNFSYSTPTLPPGLYTVTIQPVDGNGQVMSPPYSAQTTVVAG
jgi:hypothetical protein